jgi:hypothetical protein
MDGATDKGISNRAADNIGGVAILRQKIEQAAQGVGGEQAGHRDARGRGGH